MRTGQLLNSRSLLTDCFLAVTYGLVIDGHIDRQSVKAGAKRQVGQRSKTYIELCRRMSANLPLYAQMVTHCYSQGWLKRGVVLVVGEQRYTVAS